MNPYTQNWKTILKANPTDWLLQTDNPKSYGTFWVLSVLADFGLTKENQNIKRACEYILNHQRDNGAFCRRRRIQNIALVWKTKSDTYTHDSIIRLLIQFSYKDDSQSHGLAPFYSKRR